MEITPEQCVRIEPHPSTQRGNASPENVYLIDAILSATEQRYRWRALPKRLGNWHAICVRMTRRAKAGVLDRPVAELQREQLIRIRIEAMSLDTTIVRVHRDGTGRSKRHGP